MRYYFFDFVDESETEYGYYRYDPKNYPFVTLIGIWRKKRLTNGKG